MTHTKYSQTSEQGSFLPVRSSRPVRVFVSCDATTWFSKEKITEYQPVQSRGDGFSREWIIMRSELSVPWPVPRTNRGGPVTYSRTKNFLTYIIDYAPLNLSVPGRATTKKRLLSCSKIALLCSRTKNNSGIPVHNIFREPLGQLLLFSSLESTLNPPPPEVTAVLSQSAAYIAGSVSKTALAMWITYYIAAVFTPCILPSGRQNPALFASSPGSGSGTHTHTHTHPFILRMLPADSRQPGM